MNWRCRCKRCKHLFLGELSDTPYCTGCTAEIEREKGDATELAAFRAQKPLVQDVIGKLRNYDMHGFDASDRAALIAACRRLAEWKP